MFNSIRLTLSSPSRTFSHTVLENGSIKIGRSLRCEFNVPLEDLSREHCLLEVEDHRYFITDLGSKNGVFVNRERLPPHKRVPVFQDSFIMLANIYTLTISSLEFVTSGDIKRPTGTITKEIERDKETVSFKLELEEAPKNTLTQKLLKKKTQVITKDEEEPEKNKPMEHAKMIIGFFVILGFILYHLFK